MWKKPLAASLVLLLALVTLVVLPRSAHAASWKLKSTEVNEVSGGWRIFVTVELNKPPPMAHQPMKFVFTKTAVFERALVDGSKEPVTNRVPLQNQLPQTESLDVDFADGTGKIYKGTRFDFMLTRDRNFEAGEYKMQVRTADGTDLGPPVTLVLKGDNPVVDRRSITFNAKDSRIKKVEGVDAGAAVAKNDPTPVAAVGGNGEVTPVGSAAPFIPPEAYEKTPEETLKEKPGGCGCVVAGGDVAGAGGIALSAALVLLAGLRRRRA
jgi:hypothetical protein